MVTAAAGGSWAHDTKEQSRPGPPAAKTRKRPPRATFPVSFWCQPGGAGNTGPSPMPLVDPTCRSVRGAAVGLLKKRQLQRRPGAHGVCFPSLAESATDPSANGALGFRPLALYGCAPVAPPRSFESAPSPLSALYRGHFATYSRSQGTPSNTLEVFDENRALAADRKPVKLSLIHI